MLIQTNLHSRKGANFHLLSSLYGLFIRTVIPLQDSKIDLLDSASAVKKKVAKVGKS
jgi:hypothetical protein